MRDASHEQVRAWETSIPWLQIASADLIHSHEPARSFTAILEYELPLEQRRPDLIVLESGAIVVIEIKGKPFPSAGDLDQAASYARDLRNYHRECHQRPVYAVLVPELAIALDTVIEGVRVVSKESLERVLREIASASPATPVTPAAFLRQDAYSPLPTLVQAARRLFDKEPLPAIKRAQAATDPALERITAIAHDAHKTRTRRLVLVTGLPGSGKTLVGLRLVHSRFLDDLAVPRATGIPVSPAVFLSGNDPLVTVLQDALKRGGGDGKVFVRRVRDYRETYSRSSDLVPSEHVLVFDEAQRAFDEGFLRFKHLKKRRPGPTPVGSEPDQFIRFAERIPGWCVVVALIGSGQEIFSGEDGGVEQWRDAVEGAKESDRWVVAAPPDLRDVFSDSSVPVNFPAELNLNTELRFRSSTQLHSFVSRVIEGLDPVETSTIAGKLHEERVRFFLTRDLELAKNYARDRYESYRDARYGLLASSKDKILPRFGIENHFKATQFNLGPWYNASADSPDSCRALDRVATEFGAQGLELDLAILAWGSDYARVDGEWSVRRSGGYAYAVRDPVAMRRNVYRVLLTRGRDGTVVFVPQDPFLDETYEFLLASGFRTFDGSGAGAAPR